MQFLMSASDTVFYVYDVCYMKFIAIYMQTLQKVFFIVIHKCVYEVGYYINPPATAS